MLLLILCKCAAFFDQIFPWSFWSIDQLDGPLHFCLLSCCVLPVVLRCVVLRFAVCCVLVFSLLCCVVLCCDLLCVLFLSSPCCVALCCVAICYCIRFTFFYYHLPSFQHRTEQLDRQTTASPVRRARPTPRNAGRSTSSTVLCISVLSFVMLCSSSCVALRCVAICCVLCSCLFPVVLRCVVLRFAVCIVLVFSLLCCVELCCDLLLHSLDIFLLSFTFVPAQDGTTRPTDNGFTSTTSSTNATTLSTTSIVCSPHPNTLFFCLVFAMPTVL